MDWMRGRGRWESWLVVRISWWRWVRLVRKVCFWGREVGGWACFWGSFFYYDRLFFVLSMKSLGAY
jgi:hypothetical protein